MIVRATVEMNAPEGTIAQNVLHFDVDSGPSTSLADIRTAVRNHIVGPLDHFNDVMNVNGVFNRIIFHEVIQGNPPTYNPIGEVVINIVGALASRYNAHGVALMMRFPTDVPRREGRFYLAGTDVGALSTTGTWAATTLIAAADGALDLITDQFNAGTGLTTRYGVLTPSTGLWTPNANTVVIDAVPDYQRRRKPGVGV